MITNITRPNTFVNGTTADGQEANEDLDTVYSGVNTVISALNTAEGTKNSLAERLNVSTNPDGTLKSTVTASAEWVNPGFTPAYVSATQFTVSGDQTDIYKATRRLRYNGATLDTVQSASYSAATNLTTVTALNVPSTLSTLEHSAITPGSSVSAEMVDALPDTTTAADIGGYSASDMVDTATAGKGAKRTSTGTLKAADATEDDDCVTKGQADTLYVTAPVVVSGAQALAVGETFNVTVDTRADTDPRPVFVFDAWAENEWTFFADPDSSSPSARLVTAHSGATVTTYLKITNPSGNSTSATVNYLVREIT